MTTKNTSSLLLVAAVATAVICTSAVVCSSAAPSPAPADPTPCPWRWVPPEDPFIQKLGSWAVDQEHTVMEFKKVENARWQGVGQQCGSMFFHNYYYELIILAAIRGSPSPGPGGDDDQEYRAVVYVVNFSKPQKVISFSHFRPAAN